MEREDPPLVLVKTWIALIKSNEEEEVKQRAVEMLLNAFGDMAAAVEYCIRNGISVDGRSQ